MCEAKAEDEASICEAEAEAEAEAKKILRGRGQSLRGRGQTSHTDSKVLRTKCAVHIT